LKGKTYTKQLIKKVKTNELLRMESDPWDEMVKAQKEIL